TISHEILIYANHMAVTNLEFLRKEWEHGNAEGYLSRLRRRDIEGDGRMGVNKVIAQLLRELFEWTFAIMFEEMHGDIGVTGKCGCRNVTCDVFACVIGHNKNPVTAADTHAANGIFGPKLYALRK